MHVVLQRQSDRGAVVLGLRDGILADAEDLGRAVDLKAESDRDVRVVEVVVIPFLTGVVNDYCRSAHNGRAECCELLVFGDDVLEAEAAGPQRGVGELRKDCPVEQCNVDVGQPLPVDVCESPAKSRSYVTHGIPP